MVRARWAGAVALVAVGAMACSAGDGVTGVTGALPARVTLGASQRDACAALLRAVGERDLAGLAPSASDTADTLTWGDDPSLTLVCGVGEPEGFDRYSSCQQVNKVGWYVPPGQLDDPDVAAVATTAGFRPRVSLVVPAQDRGDVSLAALTELSEQVPTYLREVQPCH
ncbi:DUF3515 family protein [Nocardioides acrostichi]|uniref:DUF3515 family protein n=1 Tax=Nocardioides acrostichi TaxID=2784339 RepID=A0A930UWL7_9ACTN|nr:DUF3515 family protein [Nocardioides acrostichi]MBF4160420.1 DUF3515 family protein [Nocardioides acrostichi]